MARAEATQADLVVAQSEPKSWFNNMFMGSVTRRLAMEGATSALLLKSAPKHGGRVAVFGSDLSEYSQRAWQQFLQMNAQGLERIIAVTAVDTRPVDFGPLLPDPTPFMPNIPVVNRDALLERLRQACPAPAGVAVEHALIDGTPADALEPYMESVGADLLVLGAQGHTWADRVAIGSVALHMTMWGRSTLLLVRPTINS
jgi:nucleotide-binding universal stress UspA family protein